MDTLYASSNPHIAEMYTPYNPDRPNDIDSGYRIPRLDKDGHQKVDVHGERQWIRVKTEVNPWDDRCIVERWGMDQEIMTANELIIQEQKRLAIYMEQMVLSVQAEENKRDEQLSRVDEQVVASRSPVYKRWLILLFRCRIMNTVPNKEKTLWRKHIRRISV